MRDLLQRHDLVEAGGIYRIVPLQEVSHQPLRPETKTKNIEADESLMLNLVFLKYITADELAKVLTQFIGEGGQLVTYAPANLLFILDSRRDMRRTMELVSLFDDNSLANQRVKLYEVKNGRPTDLAHELESIFKGISMSDKLTTIRFVPVDRINTLIAVAPNPGVFETVDKWLDKLDVAAEVTAGAIDNFVYRVKYGEAEFLAMAIYALYTGQPIFGGGGGFGGGYGGGGFGGGYGGGSFGGGGGYGGGGFGGGGFGGGGYGGGGISGGAINYPAAGSGGYGAGGNGAALGGAFGAGGANYQAGAVAGTGAQGGNLAGGVGQTGSYLAEGSAGSAVKVPHIIANPLDNTLLIQATPAEYKSILKLLTQIDVPPRQVLIDAKIYEVDVSDVYGGSLTACVQLLSSATSCLQGATATNPNGSPINGLISAALTGTGATATLATVVDSSRQLLAALELTDTYSKGKSIATPSVIATDSIPASINVGSSVPSISGQAVATGVQQGGSTGFYQNISQVDTGIQLQVVARVTPAGVVTMVINQKVSAVLGSTATLTPSFSNRNITTQVTVQDGDTVALGGAIQEAVTEGSGGIPYLSRIPYVGALFGQQSKGHQRTELIVFLTPHVLYDTNMTVEAADELRGRMKLLQKVMRNDKDQQ